MTETVFSVLKKKVDEDIEMLTVALASGQAENYAEYRYMCGQIRGLMTAHVHHDTLLRSQMEDDDDE